MRSGHALLAVAAGLVAFATAAPEAMQLVLPPFAVKLDEPIEIGEMRNRLVLDSVVDSEATLAADRLRVRAKLHEPGLYRKLETALRSRANSGCSALRRAGSGQGAFEIGLCHIARPSVRFDPATRSARVRATAKLRAGFAGLGEQTGSYGVTAEYRTDVREGEIHLTPRAIRIDGMPPEFGQVLLAALDPMQFPLDRCLRDVHLQVDDLRLDEGSDEVTAAVSAPAAEAPAVAACAAARKG